MKRSLARQRVLGIGLAAAVALVGAVACSSDSKDSASGGGSYAIWDPYPQFDGSSDWAKLLDKCGTDAGVTIKRTGYDTTDLTSKTLLAAQQGNSPDVLIIDNPVISTLADAGVLATTEEAKIDTSAVQPNLLAAGQIGGKTYGIPIGANTLALYYNKKVLTDAKVDVATIKDWATLTAALAQVKAAGKKGITFSAIGTEEGSFQFLPWFWGSGANLTALDSSQATAALALWTDWVKQGYAPNSVINNTQTTSWQEFATGDFAFSENGTWQLGNAKKAGFEYGIIAIPGMSGGTAPAPTGGEFVSMPVQKDTGRYATTQKLVTCLSSTDNSLATDTTLVLHRADQRGPGQAGGRQRRAEGMGRRGQGCQGPDQRQSGYQVPEDLPAAVDGRAGRAERVEDAAGRLVGGADRGRRRHQVAATSRLRTT